MPHGGVSEAAKNTQRLLCCYAVGRLQVYGRSDQMLQLTWSTPRQHVARAAQHAAKLRIPTQSDC